MVLKSLFLFPSLLLAGAVAHAQEATPSAPDVSTDSVCRSVKIDTAKSQVCVLVNQARRSSRESPLKMDFSLSRVAQRFAEDMKARGYFNHVSPEGMTMEMRLHNGGVSFGWAGENIARGQHDSNEVMKGWMRSSGHRENILNRRYRKIGVGHAGSVWVQEFSD